MNIDQLQRELARRVNQQVLATLHGNISLHCGQEELLLLIDHGQLSWQGNGALTDVTFFFESPAQAYDLLCGGADVMVEFMAGRFRSSGYLLWTFPLLTLFRGV